MMASCMIKNCLYNDDGDCDNWSINIEGYCINKSIDEGKCEYCGLELVEIEEKSEHFGFPCSEVFLKCPNGCDD